MSRHSRWRRGFGAFAGPVAALARCRLLRSLIGRAATVRSDLKKTLQLDDSTHLLSDCDRRAVRGAGPFHGRRPDAAPPLPGGTPLGRQGRPGLACPYSGSCIPSSAGCTSLPPSTLMPRTSAGLPRQSPPAAIRSEEHTSALQSLMRISYAVFCLKKNKQNTTTIN